MSIWWRTNKSFFLFSQPTASSEQIGAGHNLDAHHGGHVRVTSGDMSRRKKGRKCMVACDLPIPTGNRKPHALTCFRWPPRPPPDCLPAHSYSSIYIRSSRWKVSIALPHAAASVVYTIPGLAYPHGDQLATLALPQLQLATGPANTSATATSHIGWTRGNQISLLRALNFN